MVMFLLTRWGAPYLAPSLILALCIACGPPSSSRTQKDAPSRSAATQGSQAGQRATLRAVLGLLDDDRDLLKVLPGEFAQALAQKLGRLTRSQRVALLNDASGLPKSRPLLHLSAGGSSPSAYLSILTTPNVAGELRELIEEGSSGAPSVFSFADLLQKLNDGAARKFLGRLSKDGATEFGPAERSQIATAAGAIGGAFEAQILDVLSKQAPTAELALQHAGALARLRRSEQANARLQEALGGASLEPASLTGSVQVAQRQVTAAIALEAKQAVAGVDADVLRARALLELDDAAGALALLEGRLPRPVHLGYEIARHEARLGRVGCGGVPRHLRTPFVCRAVHAEQMRAADWPRLKAAWGSGRGRDVAAVETYLALCYVLPMTYGLDGRGESGSAQSYLHQVSGLAQAARQSAGAAPHFSAMAAFADVLEGAFVAARDRETPRGAPGPRTRTRLLALAAAQSTGSPAVRAEAWSQAARLAVAALLVQDVDPQPILEGLTPALLPAFYRVHAALSTWNALSRQGAPALAPADVARVDATLGRSSLAQLEWRLTQAEANAYQRPGTEAAEALRSIAQEALLPRQPLHLRLRAGLSVAGMAARAGRVGEAWQMLEVVQHREGTVARTRDEQELLIAVRGYQLLLDVLRAAQARATSDVEVWQQRQATFLNFVTRNQGAGIAPPAVRAWLSVWGTEIAFQSALAECDDDAACVARAESKRGIEREALESAMGEAAVGMFARGRLALGGLSLELSWSQDMGRLKPKVQLSPRFPYVHFPGLIVREIRRSRDGAGSVP